MMQHSATSISKSEIECSTFHSSVVDDAGEMIQRSSKWNMSCVQVKPGRFSGTVQELWLRSLQVIHEHSNLGAIEHGSSWGGSFTVALVKGRDPGPHRGHPVRDGDICTNTSEWEVINRLPDDLDRISVTVDAERFLGQADATGVAPSRLVAKDLPPLIHVGEECTHRFREDLISVLQSVQSTPDTLSHWQTRRTLEDFVISSVHENIFAPISVRTDERGQSAAAKHKTLHKALEYIAANRHEPVTVLDLCENLHVSRRTLQYSFESILGVNPLAYLRLLRLNGARRDLKQSSSDMDISVTEVAMRWGFWHLARFSSYYRALFGESPSATLKRRRAS